MVDLAFPSDRRPSRLSGFAHWFRTDLRGALSLSFLLVLVAVSALAPWLAPYSPIEQDLNAMMAPMSGEHWLGADDLGRDILSRLIYGGMASLYASFLAVAVAILIGVPVGLFAGFLGGWVDDVVSRVIDSFLSFPAIVLAIAVTGALGIGLTNGMISVGIVFAPQLARLVRARTLVVRNELYVDSARCSVPPPRAFYGGTYRPEHDPACHRPGDPAARGCIARRSQPQLSRARHPAAECKLGLDAGARLSEHGDHTRQMYPPGLAILFTALAFNTLGKSLRLALDPTIKRL